MAKHLKEVMDIKSNGYAKRFKQSASASQVLVNKSTEQSNLNTEHSAV